MFVATDGRVSEDAWAGAQKALIEFIKQIPI